MKRSRVLKLVSYLLPVFLTLFLILLTETGLRIFGFGVPSSYYLKQKIAGEAVYFNNIYYTGKFFTPELIRTPMPFNIPVKREENTVRIAIFGESAALGDPNYCFGFSRILEVMLEDAYPEMKFEILNTSITAINSNVILPIVKETARKINPDLYIIYMGNNEFIGPYSQNGNFSGFIKKRGFIKLNIAINSTRIGQLVRQLSFSLFNKNTPSQWDGMEMFSEYKYKPGDESQDIIYQNFRANLEEICRIATHKSEAIVSSVAVNIADCPPFLSIKSPEIDSSDADVHYLLAEISEASGNQNQARYHYNRALDLDALKFRADGKLNEMIKNTCLNLGEDGVHFIDMPSRLSDSLEALMPGSEIFLEHVHFNFYGNYLLAYQFKNEIVNCLGLENNNPPVKHMDYYKNRLAYTAFEDYKMYTEVLSRLGKAPFINQMHNEEAIKTIEQRIAEIKKREPNEEVYKYAIDASPDDWIVKYNYSLYLMAQDIYSQKVLDLLNEIHSSVPQHPVISFYLGSYYENNNELMQALGWYEKALDIFPYYPEAKKNAEALKLVFGKSDLESVLRKEEYSKEDLRAVLLKAGDLSYRNGRESQAATFFSKAKELNQVQK